MKFVDTNVLIRFLTRDVPELADQASDWIASASAGELMIGEAVLVELTFVLTVHENYRIPRKVVVDSLERLSSLPSICMSQDSRKALEFYGRLPKLDFVDCLLLAQGKGSAASLVTFDQDLLKAAEKL